MSLEPAQLPDDEPIFCPACGSRQYLRHIGGCENWQIPIVRLADQEPEEEAGEVSRLRVPLEENIPTSFGPKLCEALGIIRTKDAELLPDAVRGIIQRHRAALAKRGDSTCTHTRLFVEWRFLEIITATRGMDGKPITICGLSTEWETLTGEPPCQHPASKN